VQYPCKPCRDGKRHCTVTKAKDRKCTECLKSQQSCHWQDKNLKPQD
jgi:hypothetical protein